MPSARHTVLLTGCSTGIGRAAALAFAAAGWNVAATMRVPERAAPLAGGSQLAVLPLDVTDRASIDAAVQDTIARFGAIDVVVNNAGYGLFGLFEEATERSYRDQIETNLFGVINMTRAVLPHFRARGAGRFVNVTSIAALFGPPLNAFYAASKFAIEGLTESLATELAPLGISFAIVQPGLTRTAIHARFAGQDIARIAGYDGYRERAVAAVMPDTTSPAAAEPEAVAAVILKAAQDPSPRLRYPAGADAEMIAAARDATDAEAFVARMREFIHL
ncbi:MAG: SDR family oxidoreductase [Gammaproteobacteria bacterium]